MEAVSEPMSSDPSKHRQELGERLDKLRTGEGFCDITISVKGKDFKAHKAVLAATSPFFLTLLTSDMKESNEQLIRIELEEATEAVMEDVFKYVYTGNVLVTEERAHNLIATANYLLLPGLKAMAGNFLKDFVTTENCIFNYYFAEKYQCLELKEGSCQVINSNFTVVMETEDFLKLDVKQVLEWVSSDDITVNAEDDVFKGIVKWVSHSKSEREGDLPELLHQVRLASVSHDFLLNEIIKEELITKNTEFHCNFLADAMKVILSSIDGHIQQPRKCLETHVDGIFVCGGRKVLCYIPEKNVWHKLADAPFDYQSNCPVQCGSKVYIFSSESHKLGDSLVMEYYLPDVNSWGSVVKTYNRTSYSSTYAVLKGFLYVMTSGESVYRYDPGTNCWVQVNGPPFQKDDSCVVSDEEHIYVIGGRKDHNVVSTTSRLDPSNEKWEDVASLSEGRKNAFGAAMNGKVYVAGGRTHGWRAISSCEVYNPLTNEWQVMPSLKVPRVNASMVCCEGRLYVLGGTTLTQHGRQSSSKRSLTVEEFDSEREEWVKKSVIPVESFESSEEQKKEKIFQACFARLYKQVIDKLKPLN